MRYLQLSNIHPFFPFVKSPEEKLERKKFSGSKSPFFLSCKADILSLFFERYAIRSHIISIIINSSINSCINSCSIFSHLSFLFVSVLNSDTLWTNYSEKLFSYTLFLRIGTEDIRVTRFFIIKIEKRACLKDFFTNKKNL